jgi:hypothetical protein
MPDKPEPHEPPTPEETSSPREKVAQLGCISARLVLLVGGTLGVGFLTLNGWVLLGRMGWVALPRWVVWVDMIVWVLIGLVLFLRAIAKGK